MQPFDEFLTTLFDFLTTFHELHPVGTWLLVLTAVIWLLSYHFYNRRLEKFTFHLNKWGSYEIEKGVRCNKAIIDGEFLDSLDHVTRGKGHVKTVYDCFQHGLEVSKDGPCLGRLVDNFTRYKWYSYSQVEKEAQFIGKMLRSRGIRRQTAVCIYGINSPEWLMAELGCTLQSLVTVPLYETLGIDSIRRAINEVETPAIFCDSIEKLKRIFGERRQFAALKMFILLNDNLQDDDTKFVEQCKSEQIELLTWSQAVEIGRQCNETICNNTDLPKPDDVFLIQYTSGTTGLAKGVVVTHRNVVAAISGAANCAGLIADPLYVRSDDSILLYMPLPHAYAQNTTVWFFYAGGKIAFASGSILRLIADIQTCKPTYFPLVPRIMNRLYAKVMDETKCGLKGWLFWKCYQRKLALYRKGCWTRDSIYDWVVFRKIQNLLGGRVRIMTTGSAPIAPEVLEFWRVVFGAIILEAYGSTECTAFASAAVDPSGGNVGHPLLCNMIRLLDVPEMGYSIENNPPQGEICLKGPNIMSGYYKRPALTKEAFTADGWLQTGDIGEFLPDGSLRIIDRRKHIFKLSQGEYIAPEKVESTYAQCPLVAQVFVDGNSLYNYVVAVIVPDETEAKKWASQHGYAAADAATLIELCANKEFQRYVLETLLSLGKTKRLVTFEQIKSLYLHPEQFTIDNDLLTPTMKNKRNSLRRRFQAEIDALYLGGPMINTDSNWDLQQRAIAA